MVTLNYNWFHYCYCMCLSENFIKTLLEAQKMVDSKKQEMQKIISLSGILHYVHYCHRNFKMSSRYKVMCGCQCCTSDKNIYLSLLSWHDRYFKNLRTSAKILKTEGPREKQIRIYGTYKNSIMLHQSHIYVKAYDMAKATMCAYPQPDHMLPHWKFVLQCCAKFPSVNLLTRK